jgi:hypothetical protein
MRPRLLIGMLIAGQDLRDLHAAHEQLLHAAYALNKRQELEHTRFIHSLIQNFLSALDQDEAALRDQLEAAIRDLSDTVARMEEHVS